MDLETDTGPGTSRTAAAMLAVCDKQIEFIEEESVPDSTENVVEDPLPPFYIWHSIYSTLLIVRMKAGHIILKPFKNCLKVYTIFHELNPNYVDSGHEMLNNQRNFSLYNFCQNDRSG